MTTPEPGSTSEPRPASEPRPTRGSGPASGPGSRSGEGRGAPGRYAAVIFDLDGVITDTAEYHYLGWQRLADEEGLAFDREFNERLRGVSRVDSLELILGDRDVAPDEFDEMTERKNRYYVDYLQQVSPEDLLPGARDVVAACKDRGLKVAIGSSSKNAKTVLTQLELTDMFDAVTDGHSVDRAKPAPDLFLHAAEQLGIAPERCIVLEDAAAGVDAAQAAGMLAVGVGPAERLSHADLRFDTVADVDVDQMLAAERNPT